MSYELADTKQTEESSFDYVILSMPLHQESKLATSDDIKLPQIKYHEMCRTLLTGSINYSLFGLPQRYGERLVTEALFIESTANMCNRNDSTPVPDIWKILLPLRQIGEDKGNYRTQSSKSCDHN
ncbi:unnamed protein product [Trichobilharzia regenti]|nr:unnamed protein product [Trichobilharzia regenti]